MLGSLEKLCEGDSDDLGRKKISVMFNVLCVSLNSLESEGSMNIYPNDHFWVEEYRGKFPVNFDIHDSVHQDIRRDSI